jgi:hypothetical protein
MNLQHRIYLMTSLGKYILSEEEEWNMAKDIAGQYNGWFIPDFVELAVKNISDNFLNEKALNDWTNSYKIEEENISPKKVGIVMAGNIPLVGFHDLLSVFMSGHKAIIKPSSKDDKLIRHLVNKLIEWDNEVSELIIFSEMLKDCDAYIATGSNNSSRYFEFYFSKFPNIIRRNRTSVSVLTGMESTENLSKLADDVYLFFGLGCRNVTKLFVPENYDFINLLQAFKKYDHLADNSKYKNNYDYNLALHLLNSKYYMSTDSILIVEEPSIFSPISQLNYEYYKDVNKIQQELKENSDVQCIVGIDHIPFGMAQCPGLKDYADGIDSMKFLTSL